MIFGSTRLVHFQNNPCAFVNLMVLIRSFDVSWWEQAPLVWVFSIILASRFSQPVYQGLILWGPLSWARRNALWILFVTNASIDWVGYQYSMGSHHLQRVWTVGRKIRSSRVHPIGHLQSSHFQRRNRESWYSASIPRMSLSVFLFDYFLLTPVGRADPTTLSR